MGGSQSKASPYGKNYAPAGKTRPIYRGDQNTKRAQDYVNQGGVDYIRTNRPGDFHNYHDGTDMAYFTYDKAYAKKLAGSSGKVIRQDYPRDEYHRSKMKKFDDRPTDDWYDFVDANRRQADLPKKKMKKWRKHEIVEGPISEAANPAFNRPGRPLGRNQYKPARVNDDPNGEYVQQVAFRGEALKRVARLPRRFTP